MWNSRYATIDVHILGIFHPDCNIPEQTPPEGNCMITADKKQEKYTLKTSLGLFSLVGGYSEAACCWFFFEQFWVVDTNAENSWAEEPLNAIFCSENVGGGAEPGELCALVFRVCITFKRAQKTLSFEELLKALVGSDKPVLKGRCYFTRPIQRASQPDKKANTSLRRPQKLPVKLEVVNVRADDASFAEFELNVSHPEPDSHSESCNFTKTIQAARHCLIQLLWKAWGAIWTI